MSILQDLFLLMEMAKKKTVVVRNPVAKHMRTAGAGFHKEKAGKHASRQKQKQQWKKEIE